MGLVLGSHHIWVKTINFLNYRLCLIQVCLLCAGKNAFNTAWRKAYPRNTVRSVASATSHIASAICGRFQHTYFLDPGKEHQLNSIKTFKPTKTVIELALLSSYGRKMSTVTKLQKNTPYFWSDVWNFLDTLQNCSKYCLPQQLACIAY